MNTYKITIEHDGVTGSFEVESYDLLSAVLIATQRMRKKEYRGEITKIERV